MSKSRTKEMVPAIRFKGFDEEWGGSPLGQVTDVYDGIHQTPTYTDSGVMFLSVENIETLRSDKFISMASFLKDFKIYPKKNDVLMTRIGDVGTANVVQTDDIKAYYVTLTLLKFKQLNPYFLKSSISSTSVKKDIWHRTLHIAFPKKINMNEIVKVTIFSPKSVTEQTKIGKYFQELDALITGHRSKQEKLLQIKKSLLEKMFPKQGQNKPEIRFKEFDGKWIEEELGQVVDVKSGRDYKHLRDGDIPVYGTGGYMLSVDEALSDDCDAVGIGRKGTIDKPYVLKAPFWTVDTLFYCVPKLDNELDFVFDVFQRVRWRQMDESTGVPSLSKVAINGIVVKTTKPQEQTKIGQLFRHLDTLISQHQSQIDKLNNIKQACLTQMFV